MKKISQARVERAVKQMRAWISDPMLGSYGEGIGRCAREVLEALGVPEREPERKGKRNAD